MLTDHPWWAARGGAARAVFDGKLRVFGGWAGETTNALNDVWISSDGVEWEQQAEHAPWAPRAPITVVFDERIWIYSGSTPVLRTTGAGICGSCNRACPSRVSDQRRLWRCSQHA